MLHTQPLTTVQAQRLRAYLAAAAAATNEPDAPTPLAEAPTIDALVAHPGVSADLLNGLDVAVAALLHAGATLKQLGELGYGARHLARTPAVASQLVGKFGSTSTAVAVLRNPQDAVDLSGSHLAVKTLRVSTKTLLEACQGDRASAIEVVRRLMAHDAEERAALDPNGNGAPSGIAQLRAKLRVGVLHGVGVATLARLGLDGAQLYTHFGISIDDLASALGVDVKDLEPLGVYERGQ